MWTGTVEELSGQKGHEFAIQRNQSPATYADVLDGWRNDAGFRRMFLKLLKDAPYSAYRWETPSITTATADRRFEFVLLDSPSLARTPDPDAFAEHFDSPQEDIVEFPNLRGDAILIVPGHKGPASAYGHIAAFVRHAPEAQQHALWAKVGQAMMRRIGDKPVWLSTAGAGVSWLHVRLDDQPKYYGYPPYRQPPTTGSGVN